MKKTLVMLSGLLLLSSTAMAEGFLPGGVASRSLSSSIAYDNPATQAFTETMFELTAGNQVAKYTGVDSVEYSISYYQLGAKFDSLLIGVKGTNGELKVNGAASTIIEDSIISLGWAWENFALAAYQKTDNNITPSEGHTGLAIDWRLGEKFYIGAKQSSGPDSKSYQQAGIAFKVDKAFRAEVSKNATDNGTGSSNAVETKTVTEIEAQWMNFVLGHASEKNDNSGAGNNVNTSTRTYLAWEPEQSGFSASIAIIDSDETDFDSGTEVNLGFSF